MINTTPQKLSCLWELKSQFTSQAKTFMFTRGVYKITDLTTRMFYIGSTCEDFSRRWKQHEFAWYHNHVLNYACMSNKNIIQAFVKNNHDFRFFEFDVLESMQTASKTEILTTETKLIKELSPQFNILR
jgi:excinuclease UvrABC nuclease subunit